MSDAITIKIRITDEVDGTFSAEVSDGSVRCQRRASREAAVAAVESEVLAALAARLRDEPPDAPFTGVSFELQKPRTAGSESRPGLQRVLLVEDDEPIRTLMRRALEMFGYRVLEACDAGEAVGILEREPRVDLMITDVILPGDSGIQLLHRVESRFPSVRGMLVSGFAPALPGGSQPFDPETPFLAKPFTADQLLTKVRELLKDGASQEPPAPPPRRRVRTAQVDAAREDVARVLLAAPNPTEARFIGNYLESMGDQRVRVETASTAAAVRRQAGRRSYDLILVDHALVSEDSTLIAELAVNTPVVTLSPRGDAGAPSPDGVVRRESAMLANLARSVSRLVGLPEPSEEARAALRHEFVDVVCHDLRNPASTIAGYSELLLDRGRDQLTREQSNALVRIRRNAYFMLDLIESILDTERLEAGAMRAKPTEIDLAALVRESVDDFQPTAANKSIVVAADLPAAPVLVILDPKLFARAVSNLISNAIKFSPTDSTIQITLTTGPGTVRLAVRDQGPGIPEAEQARLFTKFGRTSVTATRGEHQTGLGLFIVKRILDLHGARIVVDSAPGRGSEFAIELDLSPRAD